MEIAIKLDVRQFEAWAGQTVKAMNSQLRSAVDKSARAARAATIPIMAKDSNLSPADFRRATPTVQGSTASNLTATWRVGAQASFLRRSGGGRLAPIKRKQSVTGSTFAVTGGGSASLTLPKAFSLGSKGGVFIRTGKGRSAIKGVYAASPSTMMSQSDGAARLKWLEVGADAASLLITAAVQAALSGTSAPPTPSKFLLGLGS